MNKVDIAMLDIKTQFTDLRLPDTVRDYIAERIATDLSRENPYTCDSGITRELAYDMWNSLRDHSDDADIAGLTDIIKAANEPGGGLPPFALRNGPQDPREQLLDPDNRTGYAYGTNADDRQKIGFVTEWFCWCMTILLNHDAVIHPSEHGGNNRFHLISPIPFAEKELRDIGASTGGGKFPQHSDATVYHEIQDADALVSTLSQMGTDVETVAKILDRKVVEVSEQILCEKFLRVDMTVLGGVLNLSTRTHVGLPDALEAHLRANGMTGDDIVALARMPVAHLAGPADGEISGFVGNICPPLYLDKAEQIIGSCINGAPGRMVYVGKNDNDQQIFERFIGLVQTAPVTEVLLLSGDYLFLPNAFFAGNSNVTHGRSKLTDSEYRIPIGDDRFGRRLHCRQYAASRARARQQPFLETK